MEQPRQQGATSGCAHPAFLVRLLHGVALDLGVPIVRWGGPLQGHVKAPNIYQLQVLGGTRRLCNYKHTQGCILICSPQILHPNHPFCFVFNVFSPCCSS